MAWISVRNWRKFQHYDPSKRAPIWVKNYTDLMDNDDYLELTAHQRAVLHGIWLAYAASRCQLRVNTASLSARLALRVTMRQLDALSHAGWIDIVASKTLADGYQDASPEVEVEKKEINPSLPQPDPKDVAPPNGVHPDLVPATTRSGPDDLPL